MNSSILTAFNSYYPDSSEPKPPLRRSSLRNTNVEIHNLQPSQILNRPLPSLPYSPDSQQFLKKIKIQYSVVTDDEYLKLDPILSNTKIDMQSIEMTLVKQPLLFEFASNPMLNSKLKDLPKFLFITEKNLKKTT